MSPRREALVLALCALLIAATGGVFGFLNWLNAETMGRGLFQYTNSAFASAVTHVQLSPDKACFSIDGPALLRLTPGDAAEFGEVRGGICMIWSSEGEAQGVADAYISPSEPGTPLDGQAVLCMPRSWGGPDGGPALENFSAATLRCFFCEDHPDTRRGDARHFFS